MSDLPEAVLSLLALAPIVVVFILLVLMRWPARRAMPLAYLAVVGLALFVWRAPGAQVAAASIHGAVTALNILFIVLERSYSSTLSPNAAQSAPSAKDSLTSRPTVVFKRFSSHGF